MQKEFKEFLPWGADGCRGLHCMSNEVTALGNKQWWFYAKMLALALSLHIKLMSAESNVQSPVPKTVSLSPDNFWARSKEMAHTQSLEPCEILAHVSEWHFSHKETLTSLCTCRDLGQIFIIGKLSFLLTKDQRSSLNQGLCWYSCCADSCWFINSALVADSCAEPWSSKNQCNVMYCTHTREVS